MDAVLFLHHLPLHEPTTRKHLALLRALNPRDEVIPLKFEEGRGTPEWQWKNADTLVFDWFERMSPKHDRFVFLEWDCFCTMPLKEFYGKAYDRPAISSIVVKPWSSEIIPGTRGEPQRMKDWHWLSGSESPELYPCLRGMVPLCGCMFRRDTMFDAHQIWRENRGLFDPLFSELRLGTLAAMSGREPERIRSDCHTFIHSGDVDYDRGPGCYHRVRI